ncbi:unknown [Sinorhizobium phage PBC5]|nr:unknown [Sinorhizobium phage PBC5]
MDRWLPTQGTVEIVALAREYRRRLTLANAVAARRQPKPPAMFVLVCPVRNLVGITIDMMPTLVTDSSVLAHPNPVAAADLHRNLATEVTKFRAALECMEGLFAKRADSLPYDRDACRRLILAKPSCLRLASFDKGADHRAGVKHGDVAHLRTPARQVDAAGHLPEDGSPS